MWEHRQVNLKYLDILEGMASLTINVTLEFIAFGIGYLLP